MSSSRWIPLIGALGTANWTRPEAVWPEGSFRSSLMRLSTIAENIFNYFNYKGEQPVFIARVALFWISLLIDSKWQFLRPNFKRRHFYLTRLHKNGGMFGLRFRFQKYQQRSESRMSYKDCQFYRSTLSIRQAKLLHRISGSFKVKRLM